jgi:TRAP-type mannitol/chloroaromatic compound transport system substrate-binding protein
MEQAKPTPPWVQFKGAAVLSADDHSTAQTTTTLRFQSRPPGYLSRVRHHRLRQKSNMASGKLKIEVLPAGAVVPAFQLLEAVNKGTRWTVGAVWYYLWQLGAGAVGGRSFYGMN